MADAGRFLFIILLGFAAGFASGAFGIGGGSVITPAIRLLLMQPSDIALGTPLPIIFPSALIGGFNYWRAGKIDPRVFIYCSSIGTAGTIAGSSATLLVDTKYIMIITGLIIIYLAYRSFATSLGKDPYGVLEEEPSPPPAPAWKLVLIGFLAGFFSGFLGLGGGTIMVPAFLFFLHMGVKESLGTSLVVIAVLAIPGTVMHALYGHIDWLIVLGMIIGVMPGAYIGSFFTLRTGSRRVLSLFSFILLAIGIIFIFKEVKNLL
ncbi:MAG: sulfite exporter TauE/SafE family protein [Actinomycetota bacterium]|nr:sulfite exporter TauE/SafE family protein [Actinomycetota bacterium]